LRKKLLFLGNFLSNFFSKKKKQIIIMETIDQKKHLVRTWIKLERYLSEFETEEEILKKNRPQTGVPQNSKLSSSAVKRPFTGKPATNSAFSVNKGFRIGNQSNL
jgi:hypothetical protein